MKVLVIGAGVVGTCTALALRRRGHEVMLIDAGAEPATGASHANAGLISPGHCFSWAEPGIVRVALQSLLGRSDGLGICAPLSPALWRWGWLFAREGTEARWLENSRAALALSAYSRDCQFQPQALPPETYGGRHAGIVYLYGAADTPGAHDARLLQAAGEPFETLDAPALLQCEPLLEASAIRFAKGVFSPRDGTGDAARYARAALAAFEQLGGIARWSERVQQVLVRAGQAVGVRTDRNEHRADAVVVAAGLQSRALLRPLGIDLPIFPVAGYSISYENVAGALPTRGAVSIAHKIAWASFAPRSVRFTGFADVGTPDAARRARRFAALDAFARQIMPSLAGAQRRQWVGARPMTPDNLPFLGASGMPGLWLNCGHGAMGWTMAHGSAQTIADLLEGQAACLDLAPYRARRYRWLARRDAAANPKELRT